MFGITAQNGIDLLTVMKRKTRFLRLIGIVDQGDQKLFHTPPNPFEIYR